MSIQWEIKLLKPVETLKVYASKAWERSMPEIEQWMRTDLVKAMVYGGHGIVGIAQTPFYKYVTSARGLSELGIEASQPPKLLQAYATSAFDVRSTKRQVTMQFGKYAQLKAATPHPADGTGHLHIDSWLDWVDGKEVESGFVPREKLGGKMLKSIRLGEPLGGLMLPRGAYGSTGLWRFPTQLKKYEDQWFSQNIEAIQKLLIERMFSVFAKKLVS